MEYPAIVVVDRPDIRIVVELQPGERVLDVACGTGIVARLAAQEAGAARFAVAAGFHCVRDRFAAPLSLREIVL